MKLKDLVTILKKEKINYMIVGGYAVNFHGYSRNTVDIDLVIKLTLSNLKKLEKSLHQMGMVSRLLLMPSPSLNLEMSISSKETCWPGTSTIKATPLIKLTSSSPTMSATSNQRNSKWEILKSKSSPKTILLE